jgi:hypothetical protein
VAEILEAAQFAKDDSVSYVQVGRSWIDSQLDSKHFAFFASVVNAFGERHVAFGQNLGAASKLFGLLDDFIRNCLYRANGRVPQVTGSVGYWRAPTLK